MAAINLCIKFNPLMGVNESGECIQFVCINHEINTIFQNEIISFEKSLEVASRLGMNLA